VDAREELDAIESRVTRQRDALLALTTEPLADGDELPEVMARITRAASDTLCVSRVGIWLYNDARTAIECLDLYDAFTGRHESGAQLRAASFPNYFRVMAESEIVAVDDAAADARTAEFAAPYLRPLGIVSMMDVPIRRGAEVIGVLCHEHTRDRRHWTADEKAFAIATSTMISLALERRQRRRVESALTLQSAALNAVAHPVVITDRTATIVWTNPAFTELTGFSQEEAVGRNSIELLSSGQHDAAFFRSLWSALTEGRVWRGEISNRCKDGRIFLADQTVTPVKNSSGEVTHFVAVKIDLTEKKRLERQFIQAQKMEVVGRLTSGIAHDFNNLLTVIIGSAELGLGDLDQDHPSRVDFDRIHEAGTRASALTRQLLSFSRKHVSNRVPLPIAGLLRGFRGMLQRLIGEDILLDVAAGDDAGNVLADESQIEQVILNLAINARDAMPRGGVLRIGADAVNLDAAFAAAHKGTHAGPHVRIVVTDTGEGMAPEVLARVFEPFFTTKEQGRGTGLGLATVHGIVEQSGGTVCVSSAAGVGTTFTIYLPRVEHSAPPAPLPPFAPLNPRSAHLLVVEDDDAVRDLAVRILRSAGYSTVSAGDGAAALRLIAERSASIDLVVTDVVLPDMSGRDLASRAALIRPGVPVLFTSGYTDDVVLSHGIRDNTAPFIAKPYTAPALKAKVHEVLAQSGRHLELQ
jgi:PAS domain S-box-containing protein